MHSIHCLVALIVYTNVWRFPSSLYCLVSGNVCRLTLSLCRCGRNLSNFGHRIYSSPTKIRNFWIFQFTHNHCTSRKFGSITFSGKRKLSKTAPMYNVYVDSYTPKSRWARHSDPTKRKTHDCRHIKFHSCGWHGVFVPDDFSPTQP